MNTENTSTLHLYAFTYPSAAAKFSDYTLLKIGDTSRDVDTRLKEQGRSAEYEKKIKIGQWSNLKTIARDYDVHRILIERGLHSTEGDGTEWFKIPSHSIDEAKKYLDDLIESIEGRTIRNDVVLRKIQLNALEKALEIISDRPSRNLSTTIIANLAPRFGKTIWALTLFNKVNVLHGHDVMILPAYWLSAHTSFINELERFNDFLDIEVANNEEEANNALSQGKRIIVPVSLHGELDEWKEKHEWLANGIYDSRKFSFADEADFGSHTDKQKEKIAFLFPENANSSSISVFASGTNVQRLAKGSGKANGMIYTTYSQIEKIEESSIIHRKFYMLKMNDLKKDLDSLGEEVLPSWTKIWGKPYGNKAFIKKFFRSLVGEEALHQELNLSNLTQESIDCFLLLVSADNKEMKQIGSLAKDTLPNHHVMILNGEFTTNRKAEYEAIKEINEAKIDGKEGVILITNQMGSRSFSVPQVQATVIAYDRGSVDATIQKVSRCLTPGKKYDGDEKEHGHIFDLSFDPNRSENIEKLVIEEAILLSKAEDINFPSALRFILSSIDVFNVRYGTAIEVTEDDLYDLLDDNDTLLRVADVTVEQSLLIDLVDQMNKIDNSSSSLLKEAINAKNRVIEKALSKNNKKTSAVRDLERLLNQMVESVNKSATSIYHLVSKKGGSYRECLSILSENENLSEEFENIFGIHPSVVHLMLNRNALNEPILDIIVQNARTIGTTSNPF